MDEKLSPQIIGDPEILSFTFDFGEAGGAQDIPGWGKGMVHVGGIPVWFAGEDDEEPLPLEWNWLDILAFLASAWPWLLLEEGYPVVFASPPEHPKNMWSDLLRRWESMPDHAKSAEEWAVKEFVLRHDLALGMHGIYLPQIFILRQGNDCFVHCDDVAQKISPHKIVMSTLEDLGNFIATWATNSIEIDNGPDISHIIEAWNGRNERVGQLGIQVMTGLTQEELATLCSSESNEHYFEMPKDRLGINPNELLAAARMTKGYVAISTIGDILNAIKMIPFLETSRLDTVSSNIAGKFSQGSKAFEQGYELALRLRKTLEIDDSRPVDPEELLNSWGIVIHKIDFKTPNLDAVSVWGKEHGPGIIINENGLRSQHIHGLRTTFAHELCHLLIDRGKSLPVAEVLGGATPAFFEQRANAFAAELLLPRKIAAHVARRSTSIYESLTELRIGYKVSKKLAALQIINSPLFLSLEPHEQEYLRKFVGDGWKSSTICDELTT